MESIIKKAIETHILEREEITALLKDENINETLFYAADKVRKEYVGDEIHLRGLIEFSNICKRNCLYCGIRCGNKNIKRFRLDEENIVTLAKNATQKGFKTIVLQSGEDPYFTAEILANIISRIKKFNVAITLSTGEMEEREYKLLKDAGADRFLLRIETTNPYLYKKFHPDMSLEHRINCLKTLKKLGYETGTGVLVGLFGQTFESLANDIIFFKEIDADMIGLGPLIVNEDTPLKGGNNGSLNLALKMIAITRLLMPDINIPATTAMETLHPKGRIMALQAGANVIMPNVGDYNEKKLYSLYPGKANVNDDTDTSKEKITALIKSIGRVPSTSFEFRKKV